MFDPHQTVLPMKAIALRHDFNKKLGQVEYVLMEFVQFTTKLPWIVALILLIVIGFPITVIQTGLLYILRKQVQKVYKNINTKIDTMQQSDIVEWHYETETVLSTIRSSVKSTKGFFMFKPVASEIVLMERVFFDIERKLHARAYPDIDKVLTPEQEAELKELLKGWKESEVENNETY